MTKRPCRIVTVFTFLCFWSFLFLSEAEEADHTHRLSWCRPRGKFSFSAFSLEGLLNRPSIQLSAFLPLFLHLLTSFQPLLLSSHLVKLGCNHSPGKPPIPTPTPASWSIPRWSTITLSFHFFHLSSPDTTLLSSFSAFIAIMLLLWASSHYTCSLFVCLHHFSHRFHLPFYAFLLFL